MENRGSTFAFAAGLSAGIFNLLIGLDMLVGALIVRDFMPVPGVVALGALVFIVTAVNFAGGCACRTHPVAGGILMLVSAFLMLMAGAAYMLVSLLAPELLAAVGAADLQTMARAAMAIAIFLTIVELVSGAAAVVSLAAGAGPEREAAAQHTGAQATADCEGVESFARQYTARLQNKTE